MLSITLFLLVAAAASAGDPVPDPAARDFETRLKDYVELHRKLEAELPRLPKKATPEEIDRNQRALGERIVAARRGARAGELFTPEVQDLVKRRLQEVIRGPDGKTIAASIMDENPNLPRLEVNTRYPDEVPLSTMPPQILASLPPLEEDLEYRFIGRRLVLVDVHAHLIVDFTEDVLP